jgi:hypothetical protein
MHLRGRVMFYATVMLMMAAAFTGHAAAAVPVDWVVGDVFVAIGNGKYQVWHNNGSAASPQYQLIQTISDTSVTGATAGCAFDSAYRLFGTDFTNSRVVRFTINNEHPVSQTIPSSTPGFSNTQSVAFDGAGNLYTGYAAGGLEKYSHDGVLQTSFSPAVELGGVNWIDVASDGQTVFYTSLGRKIFTFSTLDLTSTVYADLSNGSTSKGKLFAIRILPPGDGSGGVLVADQEAVRLVKASGGVITSVQTFKFRGESNLQALTLDPTNTQRFWVGDATTNHLLLFDMSKSRTVATLNTGAGTTLGGVCTDGGFSAAQGFAPPGAPATQSFSVSPANSTFSFISPTTGTILRATLANLQNNATVTVRRSLVDPSVAASDLTVFSFNPGSDVTSFSGRLPCDQTFTTLASMPNTCEVFQFEAKPGLDTSVLANIQICPPSGCDGPPFDVANSNPRLIRNLDEDITNGINTFPLSGTRSNCVYTVNQQSFVDGAHSCGFQSPTQGQTFTKVQGSSIPFKFVAVGPGGTCPPSASGLLTAGQTRPLLMIAKIVPGVAPTPQHVIVKGNSGGFPVFTFSGNTWQLQVDTSNLSTGNYLATVIDLMNVIPAFNISFSLK